MENFEYRVSVIVPIYNGSEYLKKCLDSLLRQTIGNNQMEVLLINDGPQTRVKGYAKNILDFIKILNIFIKKMRDYLLQEIMVCEEQMENI